FASLQEICVDRIGWREPDARKAVLVLPGQPLQALLRLRLIFSAHEFSMTADYSGLADLIVAVSKGFPRVGRTAPEVGFGGSVSCRLFRRSTRNERTVARPETFSCSQVGLEQSGSHRQHC